MLAVPPGCAGGASAKTLPHPHPLALTFGPPSASVPYTVLPETMKSPEVRQPRAELNCTSVVSVHGFPGVAGGDSSNIVPMPFAPPLDVAPIKLFPYATRPP